MGEYEVTEKKNIRLGEERRRTGGVRVWRDERSSNTWKGHGVWEIKCGYPAVLGNQLGMGAGVACHDDNDDQDVYHRAFGPKGKK